MFYPLNGWFHLSTVSTRCRKRERLERLPRSKTISKFMDLIGRGQCSIQAAAEIARDVAPGQHRTFKWQFSISSFHQEIGLLLHGTIGFQFVECVHFKHDDCNVNPGFKKGKHHSDFFIGRVTTKMVELVIESVAAWHALLNSWGFFEIQLTSYGIDFGVQHV